MTSIRYIGEYKVIDIYLMSDNAISFRGRKANAVIFDSSFSYNIVAEIFIPLANVEPSCGCFSFQKSTLEKDLEGIRILPDYSIDLE